MASGVSNGCNSNLNDSIDKSKSKIHSNEHEETIKIDQMATKKLSSSIDEKSELANLDDNQLKSLLDEAMDYKNPRDANDKSDIFKQLLKNVTEEDMKRNERYNLGTYGLKQSNSLQNLLDDSHYQLSSNQSHTSSKKHHQQRRKNSTSVSARRLEGGSLPIDMHHSSAVQSPPDQPFLLDLQKKRKEKLQKETVIDIGEDELIQRRFDKDGISSSYPHDGIEMKSMSYMNSVEMEIEEPSKFLHNDSIPTSITTISSISASGGGPPLATHSIINPKVTSSAAAANSAIHSVDKLIEIPSLIEKAKSYQPQRQMIDLCGGSTINHANNIVLTNPTHSFITAGVAKQIGTDTAPLTLDPSYLAVKSCTSNPKSTLASNTSSSDKAMEYLTKTNHENQPVSAFTHTTSSMSTTNQSAAATTTKDGKIKGKRSKKINEKVIEVESIIGFRGADEVEDLLKYIEDGGSKNQKSHPKNGIVTSDHLLSADEKKKKMTAKNKEKVNKLKKSNSMDELCSTGRQDQEQEEKSSAAANKIIQDVTLRSKSSNLTSGAKKGDKNEKSQQKRNERRSWGTEGLWTEASKAADPPRDTQDEPQEIDSSSSSSSTGITSELNIEPKSVVIVTETASAVVTDTEFHVVTKKKKVKRKSNDASDMSKQSNHVQNYNIRRDGNIRGARHHNDHDMGPKNTKNSKPLNQDAKMSTVKNRRKSTSSMPPSDDDWNSDGGDSVQSLPIETTKTTSSQLLSLTNNTGEAAVTAGNGKDKKNSNTSHHQQQKPATFSYADIAKTNANRNSGTNVAASTEKWPSITASSSSTTHQNNNDPFSIANFDAVSNTLSNYKSQQLQQPQHHQKPAAPITTSMMSFPELVETNNNKNKQLSSNPSASSDIASYGETINTTEKPLNGLDAPRAFDNNNNNNNNSNVVTDDRINNNNQKISYSQSLLESHQEVVDSNGNNVKTDIGAVPVNGTVAKAVLTKSKSVDHNNLSSIEHYPALEKTQATLSEVFSKPAVTFESYASRSKQKPLKNVEVKDDRKLMKKDKLKKSSVQSPHFSQSNAILNCRPAVIILNDAAKPVDADCGGITFGFDINEHLLFGGYQNGDDTCGDVCVTEVSLETNNNNNCDITNTNLSSNNNLTNQPCALEIYENFIAPQSIIIGDHHVLTMSSQSSPKQQHNALDFSGQSPNDLGYLSSSLITVNSTSPATQKSMSSMPSEDPDDPITDDSGHQRTLMDMKRSVKLDENTLVLPQFILPQPVKFNQDELVSFVSDEWTKFNRHSAVFNGQ